MLEGLKKKVRNAMQRTGADLQVSHEFRTVFDVSGVPSLNQFYMFGIFPWKYVYKGFYKAWHVVPAPTIENDRTTRQMESMHAAKAICAELAGMVWSECNVHVSTGMKLADGQTDPLDDFVQGVLKANNFSQKMQEHIEQSLALGGGGLKAWRDIKHDSDGNEIPESESIQIGYAMADQFVPIDWDNAKVNGCVFISRKAIKGYYYTRLEWHRWDGSVYTIDNELYKAAIQEDGAKESQDILGFRYPLNEIYPFLNEHVEITDLPGALFSYYRTPVANNLDDNSPLGMSIYGNAMETLHALDICYDSFIREFRLGRRRIIVPASSVKQVIDPMTGQPRRYFDASDEVYQAFSTDDPDAMKVQDDTVSLRVDEHIAALNAFLGILCLQVGFSTGTFTFDAHEGLKTATEVISEESKTYKTIVNIQQQLKPAIEQLVRGIINIARLYGMQAEGVNFSALSDDDYEVNVDFDDSVLEDKGAKITRGLQLVGAGLQSKKTFLMNNLGMTEEEAQQELDRIAAEKQVTANMFNLSLDTNDDTSGA